MQANRKKLTKGVVDAAPTPTEAAADGKVKPVVIWDTELKGFGLRIASTGRKTYFIQRRVGGVAIKKNIGTHGKWTPDRARDHAKDRLRDMEKGANPWAVEAQERRVQADVERRERAESVTLREVADKYLAERPLKPRSVQTINRHITFSFAAWVNKPLKAITREDVSDWYNAYRDGGLHGDKGAPAQANQGAQILKAIFNFAAEQYRQANGEPIFTHNPVRVLKGKTVKLRPRTRRIRDDKIGEVWHMLTESRKRVLNAETLAGIDLVMLLLLTGCRLSECAELTWDRVRLDGDSSYIFLPDPKNLGHSLYLPLSAEAQQLLLNRPRHNSTDFVFPSWSKAGHIMDPRDTLNKISAICDHTVSCHDLRRTMVTFGITNCRLDIYKVELLSGHKPGKNITLHHYTETEDLRWLLPEAQAIANFIVGKAEGYRAGLEKRAA